MTRLRKGICVLLTAVLVLTSFGFGVIASADGGNYDGEVSLLVGLGILEGSGSGNMNLEKNVTRGEFSAMIYRMLDLQPISSEVTFEDVGSGNWAYEYIQTAVAMGYLSGDPDGRFRPDDTIITEEAVKVLVSILGYTYPAENEGGYANGYISVGNKIGVMRDMELPYGRELTRGEVAKMLYNSLHIDLMKQTNYGNQYYNVSQGSTILTDYLHIADVRGMVRANHQVNLDGDYEIEQGQVVIGDTLYYVGKTDIDTQLGLTVHAYVKIDDTDPVQTVLYYEPISSQKTISVKAEDVQPSTTETSFVYWENGKKRSVSIPSDVTLVYNGKAKFSFTAETLQPKEGDVTLVMDGGALSVIIVNSYESRVVQSVSEVTKTIYYKNNTSPTNLEDPEIQYTILKKDKKVDIDELAENDIVSIAASEDGLFVNIIVSNEVLTGTVTEVSDDKYAVDDMAYPVSEYYSGKKLEVGKEGTFYLDAFGYIVYAEYTSTSRNYAFLLAKAYNDSISPTLRMKLLTVNGEIVEKVVESKVNFNDVRTKVEAVDQALAERQLIKVQFNSAGELRGIWTAADNTTAANPIYDTEEFSKDISGKEMRYKDNVFSDGDSLFCTEDDTPVMIISLNAENDINERECSVSTAPKTFANDTKYSDMIFYDLDADTHIPKIMVQMQKRGASLVNADNGVCVIYEIYTTTDKDGNPIDGLRYYKDGQLCETPVDSEAVSTRRGDGSDSKNVPDDFQNVTLGDLQKGDVIQISTNIDGYISVFRPVFVQKYAPEEYKQLVSGGGSGYTEFPTFETYYGTISSQSTQILTLKLGAKERSVVCGRPKVYRLNRERNRLEVLNVNDLSDYLNREGVFAHVSRKVCQTVVIYD